jgi:hypothetical protein
MICRKEAAAGKPAAVFFCAVAGGPAFAGFQVERGNPAKPFYARDLTPKDGERARAVCTAAGVKPPALLEACTLDTAVLGNRTAARGLCPRQTAPRPVAAGHARLVLSRTASPAAHGPHYSATICRQFSQGVEPGA